MVTTDLFVRRIARQLEITLKRSLLSLQRDSSTKETICSRGERIGSTRVQSVFSIFYFHAITIYNENDVRSVSFRFS